MRNRTSWVSTRSDTNWPVKSQKKARSSRFWIQEEEGLYYSRSENKGSDQLCSYCTGDLHLCLRISKLLFFSCNGSYDTIFECKNKHLFEKNIYVVIITVKFEQTATKVTGKLGSDAKVATKILLFGSDHLVNRFVSQFVPNHLLLL